jgi:hypothetical protein
MAVFERGRTARKTGFRIGQDAETPGTSGNRM